MKTIILSKAKILASALAITSLLWGCGEMFENPMKDKETGDDINLLIVDFNFFTTRISFKLYDSTDSTLIMSPADFTFSGKNGNDIVTYAGEKQPKFSTTQGQLELTTDPNIPVTENSPFEFAVSVAVPGYNAFSKGIQFRTEGKKTVELYLTKTTQGEETQLPGEIELIDGDTSFVFFAPQGEMLEKSANLEDKPYKISYAITLNNILKLKDSSGNYLFNSSGEVMDAYNSDPDNFILLSFTLYNGYTPGVDLIDDGGILKSVLFRQLETGQCTRMVIGGKEVASLNGAVISSSAVWLNEAIPDIFGFAEFNKQKGAWQVSGVDTVYQILNFEYTLVQASLEDLCATGCNIIFTSAVKSSFSLDADVYDTDGNYLISMNFKGSFPDTFLVENVPQKAVKLVFRNNNPSFTPVPALEIPNFCTGTHQVYVSATPGYKEYQIVLKALCPDNPAVGIAPTYSGEVKIVNSSNPWQGIDMAGGVSDILGLPGQEYQLRLLWENDWEYSTYHTEFDAQGNYLHETSPKTKIRSEVLPDGRIRINVEQVFNQNVCDDMGW